MVAEARRILSYMELPEEQQPPESIWHSSGKCREWIKQHNPFAKDKMGSGMLEFDDSQVEKATK